MNSTHTDFMGAKLALYVGSDLVCLHRDNRPDIVWPDAWDFPGGGREGDETPIECAQRETEEEFGLIIPQSQIRWGRCYTNSIGRGVWFFVGWMPTQAEQAIRFGDEGQGWSLMSPAAYLSNPKAVPQLQARLRDYQNGVVSMIFTERPPAK